MEASVTNPIKKRDMLANYTSYTLTTYDSTDSTTYTVHRRFNDFLWLHGSFVTLCTGVVVPPLPKKKYLGRFHEDFLEARMRGLQDFLNRALNHPVLQSEPYLLTFLQTGDIKQARRCFEEYRRRRSAKGDTVRWLKSRVNSLTLNSDQRINSALTADMDSRVEPIKTHLDLNLDRVKRAADRTSDLTAATYRCAREVDAQSASLLSLSEVGDDTSSATKEGRSEREFSTGMGDLSLLMRGAARDMDIQVKEPMRRHADTVTALSVSLAHQQERRRYYLASVAARERKDSESLRNDVEIYEEQHREASERLLCDFDRYKAERSRELLSVMLSLATIQTDLNRESTTCLSRLASRLLPTPSAPRLDLYMQETVEVSNYDEEDLIVGV
mmetsp:Transcript_3159/g.4896  ORF Transcript_3159/g.4896 Transcript_3159/m.4896 type:complete len:386 (-) Transcript_3159:144-1301(-)|eukprot:CAMPEP_0185030748 /NCGR_PEP_ID=MMETSP1103-20130426/17787_1 /TAXON_ID=36769 /ORGANISM="Paraphysomonas bandaiensis, Strain Caron Lab Isolate" /LENGTH=385 /DNA_ID=CAMNT_0027565985 /DNA_START=201 /DNA_END=1358 /DNA_ORIENTATION=+